MEDTRSSALFQCADQLPSGRVVYCQQVAVSTMNKKFFKKTSKFQLTFTLKSCLTNPIIIIRISFDNNVIPDND